MVYLWPRNSLEVATTSVDWITIELNWMLKKFQTELQWERIIEWISVKICFSKVHCDLIERGKGQLSCIYVVLVISVSTKVSFVVVNYQKIATEWNTPMIGLCRWIVWLLICAASRLYVSDHQPIDLIYVASRLYESWSIFTYWKRVIIKIIIIIALCLRWIDWLIDYNITWIRRENSLNLSILVREGKEINWESLSSGERTGKSSSGRLMVTLTGVRFGLMSWLTK